MNLIIDENISPVHLFQTLRRNGYEIKSTGSDHLEYKITPAGSQTNSNIIKISARKNQFHGHSGNQTPPDAA
jgi:DNA-directed RNA polymerase alpha subunit